MVGEEALALQGFDFARMTNVSTYSNYNKLDLAGNAFCGYILTALCTSMFACVDWDQVMAANEEPQSGEEGSEEEAEKASDEVVTEGEEEFGAGD